MTIKTICACTCQQLFNSFFQRRQPAYPLLTTFPPALLNPSQSKQDSFTYILKPGFSAPLFTRLPECEGCCQNKSVSGLSDKTHLGFTSASNFSTQQLPKSSQLIPDGCRLSDMRIEIKHFPHHNLTAIATPSLRGSIVVKKRGSWYSF